MYICKECGNVFEDPVFYTEADCQCANMCSPCCFGAFVEFNECEICGKHVISGKLCSECKRKALEKFRCLLKHNFEEIELEYIDRCVEGISLCEPDNFTEME